MKKSAIKATVKKTLSNTPLLNAKVTAPQKRVRSLSGPKNKIGTSNGRKSSSTYL